MISVTPVRIPILPFYIPFDFLHYLQLSTLVGTGHSRKAESYAGQPTMEFRALFVGLFISFGKAFSP